MMVVRVDGTGDFLSADPQDDGGGWSRYVSICCIDPPLFAIQSAISVSTCPSGEVCAAAEYQVRHYPTAHSVGEL